MNRQLQLKAKELLKIAGLRRTNGRIDILTALLKSVSPMTQERISKKLGAKAPNKVTVYRTLETLIQAGIVHKAFLQERTWHYEPAHNCTETQCHPHFTCTNCESTHCLPDMSFPMNQNEHKGFVIHHQRVQFDGLCPKCS
ncbi:MAG: Fur family transcriptional regulator [Planctomycetota bacterium]